MQGHLINQDPDTPETLTSLLGRLTCKQSDTRSKRDIAFTEVGQKEDYRFTASLYVMTEMERNQFLTYKQFNLLCHRNANVSVVYMREVDVFSAFDF